jgi:hypothetical protein
LEPSGLPFCYDRRLFLKKSNWFVLGISVALAGCLSYAPPARVENLVKEADFYKSNDYFTVQLSNAGDGSDVDPSKPWVTGEEMNTLDIALSAAKGLENDRDAPAVALALEEAVATYKAAIKADGSDPYFRGNPGEGIPYLTSSTAALAAVGAPWTPETGTGKANYEPFNDGKLHKWRANEGRLLWSNDSGYLESSIFELVANPFAGESGDLIKIHAYHDPAVTGRSFGGFGIRAPLTQSVTMNNTTFIEFDLYYPLSAAGKWMRMGLWSTDTGGEGSQAGSGRNGSGKAASTPWWFFFKIK